MDRRTYLATGASLAAAGLAGCAFTAEASTAPPDVPQDALESGGWTQTGEETGTVFEESYGPVTVTGKQHTLQYADQALTQKIADRTLGQVEATLSVFFATHIDFSPNLDNLPGGVGQAEILSQVRTTARQQFIDQMEAQGLTDVQQTGEGTIEIDTGETAQTDQLSAVYPFSGIDFQVVEGESVEIPPADVAVAGVLAVWQHGDFVVVSGGAYPAENYATTVEEDLSEGVTVTVDVDLGLTPDAYRSEVRSLIAGVE